MIRLFVGVALPEDIRLTLAGLCGGVPGARWVATESFHMTLRFIGEVSEGEAEDIHTALGTINARTFSLMLSGVGHFESAGQVHTLWAGVEKNAELLALRARIESALVRIGLPPEGRRYSPHVTLARLKDTPIHRVSNFLALHGLFRAGPIPVGSFTLFSSFLKSSGALYHPEAEYPLRAA